MISTLWSRIRIPTNSRNICREAVSGRTLQVFDGIGTPLEFCAAMDRQPRLLGRYELYRGGAAQRLDHYQVAAQDVQRAYDFYHPLGFVAE